MIQEVDQPYRSRDGGFGTFRSVLRCASKQAFYTGFSQGEHGFGGATSSCWHAAAIQSVALICGRIVIQNRMIRTPRRVDGSRPQLQQGAPGNQSKFGPWIPASSPLRSLRRSHENHTSHLLGFSISFLIPQHAYSVTDKGTFTLSIMLYA